MVETRLALGVLALAALNIPTSSDTTNTTDTSNLASADADGASTLVVDGLALLPASQLGENPSIMVADLDAATAANGLERPTDPADPDGTRWLGGLTGFAATGESPPPVFVPLPQRFVRTYDPAGFTDAVGWSIIDVGTIAAIESPPQEFVVVGDELSEDDLSSRLTDLGGGVLTDRDGEDLETDLGEGGPVDELGRPVRLGATDGHIAISLSTTAVESWLAGSAETLADDPALLAVGSALDDAGVVSAFLSTADPAGLDPAVMLGERATPEQIEQMIAELSDVALTQPYDAVGMGWAASEAGEPVVTLALHFLDDDAATEATTRLPSIFADGVSVIDRRPLSERLEVLDAVSEDSVAVVTLRPAADGRPQTLFQMFMQRDLPFIVLPS